MQKTISADSMTLVSTWTRVSSGNQPAASIATGTRTFEITGLSSAATITRVTLTVTVSGVGAYGSNKSVCTAGGQAVDSGTGGEAATHTIVLSVATSRTVQVEFVYQANSYVGEPGGHRFAIDFTGIELTVEYVEGEVKPIVDNRVLVPEKGVYLIDGTTKIKLQPVSSVVSESANADYELTLEHPKDREGRWQLLLEEKIIQAPVPPHYIPSVTMPVKAVWHVKSSVATTNLYSKLPTAAKTKSGADAASNNPSGYVWSSTKQYKQGTYVATISGSLYTIWKAVVPSLNKDPQSSDNVGNAYWVPTGTTPVGGTSSGTGAYSPGTVVATLVADEPFTFISYYSETYIKVRSRWGIEGYVRTSDCEQGSSGEDPEPYVTEEKAIYHQRFRIYSVSCDEESQILTINASHISYDMKGNRLFDCQIVEADPATAIAQIQGNMMLEDNRKILCPLDGPKINGNWSFQNPVQALLDPDEGLAAQLKAKVLRDDADIYILSGEVQDQRQGARLAYGVNLRGVTWERSTEDLVTRIIPRAGSGSESGSTSKYLYLDELYLDSAHIDDYAYIRIEILDSKYSVGQKITKADGTTQTLTQTQVIERMRQEAENRFVVDKCDAVAVTLDVDFLLLGDTEEYRQYRNLQRVNLFDIITIDTGSMETTAQVNGYEWDCLNARYNSISIGRVYSQNRRIPGYRMATGTVTYSKLAPGLVEWIRGDT